MQKLLIAECSKEIINRLKKAFRNRWKVLVETDGEAIGSCIESLRPDAMIFDLRLPDKNGLQVLENLFPNIPPVTLVLTDYTSPYILQTLESFGVGCVLSPQFSPDYIKNLVDDMYKAHISPPNRIDRHLIKLGIDGRLSGYRCLSSAIANYSGDQTKLLKEIYPETAKECGLNDARCVERVIRSAIYKAWLKRDLHIWTYYFSPNENGDVDLPSNKQFIFAITKHI